MPERGSKTSKVYEKTWKSFAQTEQAKDGNKIWRMHFACWTIKDTHTYTHTEYAIIIVFFNGDNGYAKALECYVIRRNIACF